MRTRDPTRIYLAVVARCTLRNHGTGNLIRRQSSPPPFRPAPRAVAADDRVRASLAAALGDELTCSAVDPGGASKNCEDIGFPAGHGGTSQVGSCKPCT